MNQPAKFERIDPADLMSAAAEFMFGVERELNLFDLRLFGIRFWPLMRMSVFNVIIRELKLFSETGTFLPSEPGFRAKMALALADPRLSRKRRRTIIVDGGFLYAVDGEMRDIYTFDAAAGLPEGSVEFVDLGREGRLRRREREEIRFSGENLLRMETWRRRFLGKYLARKPSRDSETVRSVLLTLDQKILARFGVQIVTYSHAFGQVVHQQAVFDTWRSYFKQRRPTIVVLGVQRYGYEGMIRAAHEAGARVAEFQHGIIYAGHFAYHFPGAADIDDAPDQFLAFGPAWQNFAELPARSEYVSYGFPYLNLMREKLAPQISKKLEMIAVLTSDPFHAEIAVDAIRVLQRAGLPIVLRPHPSDMFDYRGALDSHGLDDVEVASAKVPAYALLAKCEFAVSGFSTVLFEAMAMGCKTLSLPLGCRRFLEPLVAGTVARIEIDIERLPDTLTNCQKPGSMAAYFEEKPKRLASVINA